VAAATFNAFGDSQVRRDSDRLSISGQRSIG
jgi:hypothetical protein